MLRIQYAAAVKGNQIDPPFVCSAPSREHRLNIYARLDARALHRKRNRSSPHLVSFDRGQLTMQPASLLAGAESGAGLSSERLISLSSRFNSSP